MKMRLPILFVLFNLLICFASANAATFTMEIKDVSNLDIMSFCLKFDVSDNFETENFLWGESIPSEKVSMGWQANAEGKIDDHDRLVIDASDYDALFKHGNNGLIDGTLFSFDYTGTIGVLSFSELMLDDGMDGIDLLSSNEFEIKILSSTSGIIQAAVPVPSAFLLLLTGLCSLAGLTRRKQ